MNDVITIENTKHFIEGVDYIRRNSSEAKS